MKIGIVGHFGEGLNLLNGQTVKTKNLYEGLAKYTTHTLATVDTHGWLRHPLRLLRQLAKLFRTNDAVIMLTAQRGVKVFPHLFALLKRLFGTRIYYDVIGGWLPEMIAGRRRLLDTLKCFDGIWVETTTMQVALHQLGLQNVTVVPNFKELTPLKPEELVYADVAPLRLCTFSRVLKEKGIETLATAVSAVNDELGYTAFALDIYGPVDPTQVAWIQALQRTFPPYIIYKGAVDSSQSVEVLRDYYALVFPTHYYTEGIPGTIIDAYCAGVPVIAAEWESFHDVVKAGETGLGYRFDDTDALREVLRGVAAEPARLLAMKGNCLQMAQRFMPDKVIKYTENILGGVKMGSQL